MAFETTSNNNNNNNNNNNKKQAKTSIRAVFADLAAGRRRTFA
jgi:hypothetical protein